MSTRTRECLSRAGLFLASIVAVLCLAEITLRLALALADRNSVDLVDALKRSRDADLTDQDAEISLKGLVQASSKPDVVYELKPGLRGTFLGQPVRINSRGLRGREIQEAKPSGTYRIAGLGDSVMFGWGVDQDEPYLAVLEEKLNASRQGQRTFEVLNFAVPGYNTAIEAAVFEHKALAFDPDLVILNFIPNDIKLPHFLQKPRDLWTLRHWYLRDLVDTRWRLLTRYKDESLLPHNMGFLPFEDQERARDPYRHMAGEEGFNQAIERLAGLTRERHIPVILLMAGDDGPREIAARAGEKHGFHRVIMAPLFGAYMRENGFSNDRQGWSQAFWLSDRDQHPNAAIHALYAQALFDAMRELSL